MPTTLGEITVAAYPYGAADEYIVCLEVEDDSTGDTEHGFGSHASAYLTQEQVAELHEFLGKLI